MRSVLFDTNVVLDVLLDREPHSKASAAVWTLAETGKVKASMSAHAFTTIHYLVRKERGAVQARRTLLALLRVFSVAPVDDLVLRQAVQWSWPDFEDAVTASAAASAGCDALITRDPKGFADSPVRTLTPESAAIFCGHSLPS
jgi:predicted nucleic acid-binding protein